MNRHSLSFLQKMLVGRSQRLAAVVPRAIGLSRNPLGQGLPSRVLSAACLGSAPVIPRQARASSSGRLQLADKYLGLEKNVW